MLLVDDVEPSMAEDTAGELSTQTAATDRYCGAVLKENHAATADAMMIGAISSLRC